MGIDFFGGRWDLFLSAKKIFLVFFWCFFGVFWCFCCFLGVFLCFLVFFAPRTPGARRSRGRKAGRSSAVRGAGCQGSKKIK